MTARDRASLHSPRHRGARPVARYARAMPDELPPVSPDLQAELTALADTLAERADHADIAARLAWLIDTLILREQLPESFRRLVAKVNGRERSVVRLATFRDKYAVASPDIDCASLIPLCGARCCSFEVRSE